jgi:hypothetical protein
VSAEWWETQGKELAMQAQAAALKHAAEALEAMEAWRAELVPLAQEQMAKAAAGAALLAEQTKVTATALGEEGGKAALKLQDEGGKAFVKLQEEGGKAVTLVAEKMGPVVESWKVELAKAQAELKVIVEKSADMWIAQVGVWAKELEGPTAAFRTWLLQATHCLCTPFAQPIQYKEMGEADYPKPVQAHATNVD